MTQGEGISALVRAWKETGEDRFAEAARRAFTILKTPIEEGGVTCFCEDEVFLEEIPSKSRSTILNGWIFALFGIYDYNLAFDEIQPKQIFDQSLATLKKHLPEYDTGYWSYYDTKGHLASPFYHDLHIHQLTTLAMVEKDPIFTEYQILWSKYREKWSNRIRALSIKAVQKLQETEEGIII